MVKREKSLARDVEFLYEIGTARYVERMWRQHFGVEVANILEHIMRVVYLALIIARREGVKNEEKIMKMALIHDLPEIRGVDLNHAKKAYVKVDEEKAADDMFMGTSILDLRQEILREYEERKSIEAKIVKDADNLDIDLELKELEQKGTQLPKKWIPHRKHVYKTKLYTKTAKKIWEEIQKSDPDSWHLESNKWLWNKKSGK